MPPSKTKTILLSHGYNSAAQSLLRFMPLPFAANFKVVTWDHVAHGASGGSWGNLGVFKDTFPAPARMHTSIEAVAGHWGGATVALVGLLEGEDVRRAVKRAVCLSPPTQFERVARRFCSGLGASKSLSELVKKGLKRRGVLLLGEVRRVIDLTRQEEGREGKMGVGMMLVVQNIIDRIVTVGEAEWVEREFWRMGAS